jgi:hypothetical protein
VAATITGSVGPILGLIGIAPTNVTPGLVIGGVLAGATQPWNQSSSCPALRASAGG